MTKRKANVAKFATTCTNCGGSIAVGDQIFFGVTRRTERDEWLGRQVCATCNWRDEDETSAVIAKVARQYGP